MSCHTSKHGRCFILAYVLVCFHYPKIQAMRPDRLQIKEVRDSVKKYIHFVGDLADDKPHTAYDFRVMINQDKAECFMQEVENSTELIFNFQALSPSTFTSDGKISAFLYILEDGTIINNTNSVRRGHFEVFADKQATYGICFVNMESNSLILTQISVDIYRYGYVRAFRKTVNDESTLSMADKIYRIIRRLGRIRTDTVEVRSSLRYDFLTTTSNLNMINNFSALSVLLILTICAFQIRAVKKMFADKSTMV
uniref:uncharacterized protein LOC120330259 n=1 Tax=Styela clava TaxID=7725 RepID=UPI001939CB75|nr:uncharacterized protein LOC120330259 [Styela clava]XP_039253070.1 uncharacterized protein LOC120330259 [Styela clava]